MTKSYKNHDYYSDPHKINITANSQLILAPRGLQMMSFTKAKLHSDVSGRFGPFDVTVS